MNLFSSLASVRISPTTAEARRDRREYRPGVARLEGREMCTGLSATFSLAGSAIVATPPTVNNEVQNKSSTVIDNSTTKSTVPTTTSASKSSVTITPEAATSASSSTSTLSTKSSYMASSAS